MNFQVSFRISLSSPAKKPAEILLGTGLHLWMDVGVFPPYQCCVAQSVNIQCLPVHLKLPFPQQPGNFMNEDLCFFYEMSSWIGFLNFYCMYVCYKRVCMCLPECACGVQRSTLWSQFFFFLPLCRLLGLNSDHVVSVASTFILSAILPTLSFWELYFDTNVNRTVYPMLYPVFS